jgi:hypothetical protein
MALFAAAQNLSHGAKPDNRQTLSNPCNITKKAATLEVAACIFFTTVKKRR